jgi:hypothetical protein
VTEVRRIIEGMSGVELVMLEERGAVLPPHLHARANEYRLQKAWIFEIELRREEKRDRRETDRPGGGGRLREVCQA